MIVNWEEKAVWLLKSLVVFLFLTWLSSLQSTHTRHNCRFIWLHIFHSGQLIDHGFDSIEDSPVLPDQPELEKKYAIYCY